MENIELSNLFKGKIKNTNTKYVNNVGNTELSTLFEEKIEPIKTKSEFDQLLKEFKFLNSLPKEKRILAYDKISFLKKRLSLGISINDFKLIDKIIECITTFLKKYNFDEKLFNSFLKNTTFSITSLSEMFGSKGIGQSSDKKIFIDISIVEFDENGYFKSFNSENLAFITHIIFHELFHRISAYRDDKPPVTWAQDTALSEGFTDFFAEGLSGFNGPQKSKNYQFSKDVCNIFTLLIGMENALDDYLNNLLEYPILKKLFEKYSLDFNKFVKHFNSLLERRYRKEDVDKIIEDENTLLIFLRDNLIIPYIENNPSKSNEIIDKFNFLFENRNIKITTKKR